MKGIRKMDEMELQITLRASRAAWFFLVLALAYVFNDLAGRKVPGWRAAIYGTTGGAVALYAAFYPVLVGIMVPTWYTTNFLRWIPGAWPF